MAERLALRAITPMTQSLEAGCVPTTIAMVLSGFGVDISEQTLVDRYFPTAKLPRIDPAGGVTPTNTIKGILQVIRDLGLSKSLRVDVFVPELCAYTRSPENRYIVQAKPQALIMCYRAFERNIGSGVFLKTLEQLLRDGEAGVYTANAQMLQLPKSQPAFWNWIVTGRSRQGFYDELADFIRQGHIVGNGGLIRHTMAVDGSDGSRGEGFVIVDPRGESYIHPLDYLVLFDDLGFRGGVFDYLFRVSPTDRELNPHTWGFRRFLQNLRDLIP